MNCHRSNFNLFISFKLKDIINDNTLKTADKLDKLITYLYGWINVGELKMTDIREKVCDGAERVTDDMVETVLPNLITYLKNWVRCGLLDSSNINPAHDTVDDLIDELEDWVDCDALNMSDVRSFVNSSA